MPKYLTTDEIREKYINFFAKEHQHTLVEKICIDRKYEEKPEVLPADFDYEVPFDYCEYHFCPKDEDGNYIVERYPAGWEGNFDINISEDFLWGDPDNLSKSNAEVEEER